MYLKDPGSMEVTDTLIGPVLNGQHDLRVEYRARNSFGGMVFGTALAYVDTETCKAHSIVFP